MSLKGLSVQQVRAAAQAAVTFARNHPLVLVISVVSIPAGVAVLAYQRRSAAPKPVPLTPDEERDLADRLEHAWRK